MRCVCAAVSNMKSVKGVPYTRTQDELNDVDKSQTKRGNNSTVGFYSTVAWFCAIAAIATVSFFGFISLQSNAASPPPPPPPPSTSILISILDESVRGGASVTNTTVHVTALVKTELKFEGSYELGEQVYIFWSRKRTEVAPPSLTNLNSVECSE